MSGLRARRVARGAVLSFVLVFAGIVSAQSLADAAAPPAVPTVSVPTVPTTPAVPTTPTVPTIPAVPAAPALPPTPAGPPPVAKVVTSAGSTLHATQSSAGQAVTTSTPSAAPAGGETAPGTFSAVPASRFSGAVQPSPNGHRVTRSTRGFKPGRADHRVVRLHVPGRDTVFVTTRRFSDCTLASHVRVNLDRSHGTVVLTGIVDQHQLPAGIYVVRITKDATGNNALLTVNVRVTRDRRVVRLRSNRPLKLCASSRWSPIGPSSTVPTTWPPGLVLLTNGGGHGPRPTSQPPEATAGTAGAETRGAGLIGPTAIGADLHRSIDQWSGVFEIGLIATLLAGMAAYTWRFLKAPTD